MKKLEKIIKLAKEENGKVFVVDQNGDPQLVVMSIEEYEKLKSGDHFDRLSQKLESLAEQTESLNKQIIDIQKDETGDIESVDEELYTASEIPSFSTEKFSDHLYIEPIIEE